MNAFVQLCYEQLPQGVPAPDQVRQLRVLLSLPCIETRLSTSDANRNSPVAMRGWIRESCYRALSSTCFQRIGPAEREPESSNLQFNS